MARAIAISSTLLIAAFALASCGRRTDSKQYTSSNRGTAERATPENIAPAGRLESYADVVDRVAPAVVTIRAARRVRQPQQFPFSDDPFFRRFFGNRMPQGGGGSTMERALGSGVIVRPDGYILTNHHVVDGAEEIKVDLPNNHQTYSAKLVGSDAPSDLAVLRIPSTDMPVLHLGDSDRTRTGDVVLAVGN